jgi:hypothetical protein
MRRLPVGQSLILQGRAAASPSVHIFTMLVLLLGGCGNSGLGSTRPDAGGAGQSGTQSAGSAVGGSGGVESSGGHESGGTSASGGRSVAGGSSATGGDSSRVGGTTSSTASGTAGQAKGGSSTGGGSTASTGGASGGRGGTSTADTSSRAGASSSGTLGGTGGNTGGKGGTSASTASGGKGGTSASTASGGTAGARSGGSTGTGSGGSTPVGGTSASSGVVETALAPVITSFCAAARNCCSLAGISTTSLADCESQFVKHNQQFGLVTLGEATIDSKVVAACKAAFDEAASSCSANAVYSVCSGILVGKQGENAPCGKGGTPMIAGGRACDHSAGATACMWTGDSNDPAVTGTCRKIAHGKKGDACLYTCESGDDCSFEQLGGPNDTLATLCFEDDGFVCSGETDPATCQPVIAQGSSCSARPDGCKSTDYCDSVSKTCKAASTAGQSCLYSSCLKSLSCGADKKCTEPFWELASDSASCQGIAQIY